MNLNDKDFRAMAKEGDLVNYVRAQSGLPLSRRSAPELKVSCPWDRCGASPNDPCTTSLGTVLSFFHEERTKALAPEPTRRAPGTWPTQRSGTWPTYPTPRTGRT